MASFIICELTPAWEHPMPRLDLKLPRGVIPCAAQHVVVRRRPGIVTNAGAFQDPVSAQRHFMPQRARDDGWGTLQPVPHASCSEEAGS